jgi:ribosomal protein S18 acetylase RimI-like enzyme
MKLFFGYCRRHLTGASKLCDVNLDNIIFKVTQHGSHEAKSAALLRSRIYSKLFGSSFSETPVDEAHIQIVGLRDDEVISTAVLVPSGQHYKMQRVVVKEDLIGVGIGSKMMVFCEKYAKENSIKSIFCHSRDAAVNFYRKNSYVSEGQYFSEDTMPHLKMRKPIR